MLQKLLGILTSYKLYDHFCPDKECNNTMNQISLSNGYVVHLHHWIIHLLFYCMYVMNVKHRSDFIEGLLLGGFFHGVFEYSDFLKIFYKR